MACNAQLLVLCLADPRALRSIPDCGLGTDLDAADRSLMLPDGGEEPTSTDLALCIYDRFGAIFDELLGHFVFGFSADL